MKMPNDDKPDWDQIYNRRRSSKRKRKLKTAKKVSPQMAEKSQPSKLGSLKQALQNPRNRKES
jgi:hypothetical protein